MTHYMKHSLLGTRRVISSIISRNFFVIRYKQPMTIGTNRMCISRDDNCVNTMRFPRQLPTTARKFFTTICFRCFLRRVLYPGDTSCPIAIGKFFLVSYFVMNFLRRISQYETAFEVCVNLFSAIYHLKLSPTFSVRPCSSVGRVTEDLIRRSWVRFPPRSKYFFFASCGSLFPFTRANAQWVIHGFT